MHPSSCDTFVALPPSTERKCIIFGKNSDRPCDEVQEVVYFPARDFDTGENVECTYIEIEQVAHTYAVMLSKPAWLWGAEMGANEHQVCIGNEAVWGRESADGDEALLGMDLVRLGLERADTAEKAVDVITELLKKYGQGGSCMEDQGSFTYHNSFLISDRKEAWLLETSGKHWAAERRQARIEAAGSRYCEGKKLLKKSNGHITAETMMDILRDKDSGINMEGMFMTTGSMVSVIPTDPTLPGVHYFTATPDPERSVFKPFIFVKNINAINLPKETTSPSYGADDPVKKKPRFQSKPDRKHELFVKHELVEAIMESFKDRGKKITENMRRLEKEKMTEMEEILSHGIKEPDLLVNLFPRCVQEEMAVYGKS
ncbi:secernin-3 isoform X2 [Notothenia coriiceps]|uniref:Secernin-3 isoform X2 n=1 Tax=Notothenia coriiceps TaxID=8208 RepID=A0A6I9PY16_9TELE|nr:PREDICTED: secernin-3 isoform X2 [Notothenia coriiceps]